MNPAITSWAPTIISAIVAVFTAGIWFGTARDHSRRLGSLEQETRSNTIDISGLKAWRDGYNAGRETIHSINASAEAGCFTYSQGSGRFCHPDGTVMGLGYAGNGDGLNNPEAESHQGHGPLPRGFYSILEPHHSDTTGRVTMNLEPDPANWMFGRSLFRIHGDNPELDHTASDGCIVLDLPVRLAIALAIGYKVSLGNGTCVPVTPTAPNRLQVIA